MEELIEKLEAVEAACANVEYPFSEADSARITKIMRFIMRNLYGMVGEQAFVEHLTQQRAHFEFLLDHSSH